MSYRFRNGIFVRHPEVQIITPTARYECIVSWELGKFTGPNQYVKQRGSEFRNLITTAGLDFIATNRVSTASTFIAVGTGSSTPANGQTALDAEVGRVNRRTTGDGTVVSGASFLYWAIKYVYLFLEAEGNGNLTEVGFFNQASTGTMWARQLFKDIGGSPTTITKTASDQLKVTYEIRLYSPTVDATQTGLVISGTSYDITTRAREIDTAIIWGFDNGAGSGALVLAGANFTNPGGRAFDGSTVLGSTTGGLSGTNAGASSSVAGSYSGGNFYRDVTMKWEPTDGNLAGGIGGFHTYGGGTTELFQSVFVPAFAKDATKRLTLVVRCAWARYP